MKAISRTISAIVTLVLVFSMLASLTFAWSSLSQRATNILEGEAYRPCPLPPTFSVELLKFARDLTGEVTDIRLADAAFYLFRVNEDNTSTQIRGRLVTDVNGSIYIEDLEPGNYYFLETQAPDGFTFDTDGTGNDITRYPFTVTPYGTIIITGEEREVTEVHVYNRRITSSLAIKKTVENADGSPLTLEQLEQVFAFTITFSDGGSYDFQINGVGPVFPLASGGIVRLRHGQQAIFAQIPVGVVYTVVETPVPGFTITSNNHQGTILEENNSLASFTNIWHEKETGYGRLRVTKEVIGTVSSSTFAFEAIFGTGENIQVIPFTLTHGGEWFSEEIPVGTPYIVREIDTAGYIATILEFRGEITNTNGVIHLPFVNVWEDESLGEYGTLRIRKTVLPEHTDTTFDFTLRIDDETHHFTLQSNEDILFEDIPHGSFFTVAELPKEGYRQSLIEAHGTIVGDMEINIHFINHKIEEPTDYVDIVVRKIVENDMPDATIPFRFILEVEGQETQTFTLLAGESITFSLPAGVTYTITEADVPTGYALIHVRNGHGTTAYGIVAEFTNRFNGKPEVILISHAMGINEGQYFQPNARNQMEDYIIVLHWNIEAGTHRAVRSHLIVEQETEVAGETVLTQNRIWYSEIITYELCVNEHALEHVPAYLTDLIPQALLAQNPLIFFYRVSVEIDDSAFDNVTRYFFGATGYDLSTDTNIVSENNTASIWINDNLRERDAYHNTSGYDPYQELLPFTDEPREPPVGAATLSGEKFWNHGNNPPANHPDRIVILILADGVLHARLALDAGSQWRWSLEVPRYNSEGEVILWTVDEEYIPDYTKRIEGHNITNTHVSVSIGEGPGLGGPGPDAGPGVGDNDNGFLQTGDRNTIMSWLIVMITSLLSIVALIVTRKWEKRINLTR